MHLVNNAKMQSDKTSTAHFLKKILAIQQMGLFFNETR